MLPSRHKLSSSDEFRRTIRKGKRAGRSTVVIHLRTHATAGEIAAVGGPRFGLVVSKAVGNAVTRHAVSRKIRHVLMGIKDQIPQDAHIVVRALPPAATATSKELEANVRSGVEKLLLR
ncbi:ribonuclease P protein component [Corynebacterium pseudotuberculosis]|uniref:ribonuclease P protein component n=1 Tax=Corynebacterium pseudotuberculosis TaxID=1719 RepID=UPI0020C8893D|nr:ribonuclease P protein component [Corynebacterium pseudotuberculosis]UTO24486.1 ribonuclease P protein component [Corynebacterium pseudotuberculosis]